MSDIPAFPYELLWGERVVRSVANLTRADGEEFLAAGAAGAGADRGRDAPAGAGQRGARAAARRRDARRRGGGPAAWQLHGCVPRTPSGRPTRGWPSAASRPATSCSTGAVACRPCGSRHGGAGSTSRISHVRASSRHRLHQRGASWPGSRSSAATRRTRVLCGHATNAREPVERRTRRRSRSSLLRLAGRCSATRPRRRTRTCHSQRVGEGAPGRVGCTAMPQWLARHLDMLVGGRIEAGVPVHDAVALRVDRDEADAGRQRPASRSQKSAQQSPSRQVRLNRPGRPERAEAGRRLDLQRAPAGARRADRPGASRA